MSTVAIEPMSRAWIKANTAPAIVLNVRGANYLTMISALRWTMHCGPGAERKRHAGYAWARIVASLPTTRPETILHRKELLGLIDGLEHFAVLDDETGNAAREVLEDIKIAIERQGGTR